MGQLPLQDSFPAGWVQTRRWPVSGAWLGTIALLRFVSPALAAARTVKSKKGAMLSR